MAGSDRLNALDLAWLELDTGGPPIAMGTVSVADGPAVATHEVAALVADRIHRMPRLAQRLQPGGHGLRRPGYVEVAGFDPAEHVRRVDGRTGGLAGALGRIMTAPLPHDRPMWDMWVIDHLGEPAPGEPSAGRWALAWRVHHSVVDGLGAVATFGHAFDLPDGRTLADAVNAHGAATHAGAAHGVGHALGVLGAVARHVLPAVASLAPRTPGPLTGPVGPRRAWVPLEVSLADVRAVRRQFGTTVNDVVLAIVAGGFRALMLHRGLPVAGEAVRALVPVSTRPPGDSHAHNEISAMVVALPVGSADPVRRLRAVVQSERHSLGAAEPLAASALLGAADRLLPAVLQDVVVHTAGGTLPAWFADTVASNVAGPQFPVLLCGRRVRRIHPVIPVAGHTCISTGVFSYDGLLCFGIAADPDRVPDLDVLVAGMRRSAADLVAVAAPG